MTIDEVLEILSEIKAVHGGTTVVQIDDADTGWELDITDIRFEDKDSDGVVFNHVVIQGKY